MNNHIDELIELVDKAKISLGKDYLSPVIKENYSENKISPIEKTPQINLKEIYTKVRKEEPVEKPSVSLFEDSNILNNGKYSSTNYQELSNLVINCTNCPAANIRSQSIFSKGDLYPKLMVIGEGPGKEEDFQNELFVGKSGQYLEKWLRAIHLDFNSDIYFTNVVKCYSSSNPTKEMVKSCLPYLQRQIELVNPKTILVLGKIAANALFENELPLKEMRGKITFYKRIPTMVTYHPAAVLRNSSWRKPVWEDLQKLEKIINI